MDESIQILRSAIQEAKLGQQDKLHAIKRLKRFSERVISEGIHSIYK